MPKSTTSTPSNATRRASAHAEPVVAEEHVADPGDQHPQRHDLRRARRRSGARARRGRGPGRRRRARRRRRGPPCRSRPRRRPRSCPPARGRRRRRPPRGRSFTRVPTGSPTASTAAPRSGSRCAPGSRACAGRPRISAFSSSVSAMMFSASSPSISPPSNRSPGDSGAIRGWSSRMIGDESIASSPTSTGQVPTFSQPAASVAETKRPPTSSVCVEQSACRSASSRSSPAHGVVLRIVTVSRAPVDLDVDDARHPVERERPAPDARARRPPAGSARSRRRRAGRSPAAPACASEHASSGCSALQAGGKTQPNVQRRWFFNALGGTARACSPRT